MKIKRLEINGFKSFVDKVSLDFQQGITGVVGPNGCGKSNIVDALRWAMGEQSAKNLRGSAMEDIIFVGSDQRKPLGRAEVTVVFDNSDGLAPAAYREYSEIAVTRRLYRTGESDYLINKTPCRLKDITEIFMDTGAGARAYSVIEQGKIGSILSAKPEERRVLIEEAAGVTKFKSRKKAALRKMDATRQNLLRINDIVNEVRRQMNSLKRQAQRAEQFRELRQEARGHELQLAAREYAALSDQLTTVRDEGGRTTQALTAALVRFEQSELALEEGRLTQTAKEKAATDSQQRVLQLAAEIQRVEGELALCDKEREGLIRQAERLQTEQSDGGGRLAQLAEEEASLHAMAQDLTQDLAREEAALDREQAELDRLAQDESDSAARLEQARNALFNLIREQTRLANRVQEVGHRLATLDERQARLRGETQTLQERHAACDLRLQEGTRVLAERRRQQQDLHAEAEALAEQLTVVRGAIEREDGSLLRLRDELTHTRSRLGSLRELAESWEGFDDGLVRLLQTDAGRDWFAGTASDLLEVAEEFERPVEAALGERLKALCTPRPADALAAVRTLQEQGGQGLFLLPAVPATSDPPPAGARPLAELVRFRPGDEERGAGLLAGMFLVADLADYLGRPLPAGQLLVTPDGVVYDGRGLLQGGRPAEASASVLRKKREIQQLGQQQERLQQQLEQAEAAQLERREQVLRLEEERAELAREIARLEQEGNERDKDLARLTQEREQLTERLDAFRFEQEQLQEERITLQAEREQAERERHDDEQQQRQRQEEVELLQEQLQVMRNGLSGLREGCTARRVAVAGLRERLQSGRAAVEQVQRQRRELGQRREQVVDQLQDGAAEMERLHERKERLQVELQLVLDRHQEQQREAARLGEEAQAHEAALEERQEAFRAARSEAERVREAVAGLQLRERELVMELGHLRQSVLDRHQCDFDEELPAPEPDWDEARVRARLRDLQDRIERLGEVNLMAIDEYRELEERYTFLTRQQEDLQQSLDELQQAITRINRTTRERFRETFDQVNAHFREVFPRLFRGGRAELLLTDDSNLLETGVDIVAQPPGKRLQHVNLLSGGEKALTAVALIFALFAIKPSPFCVLDEVDAPLDDANVGRFAEVVREMAARTQFIVITHNKKTMEGSDVMYGVTMEEPGVSKIVSVRMNAA